MPYTQANRWMKSSRNQTDDSFIEPLVDIASTLRSSFRRILLGVIASEAKQSRSSWPRYEMSGSNHQLLRCIEDDGSNCRGRQAAIARPAAAPARLVVCRAAARIVRPAS